PENVDPERREQFYESFSLLDWPDIFLRVTQSALQRIRELQEQTAIANNMIARLQPTGDFGLTIDAFSHCHRTPAELVLRSFGVNEGLVLVVPQDGRIRQ